MDSIQCVSLPRSGHNLLVQHLQKYFGCTDVCLPSKLDARSKAISRRSNAFKNKSNAHHPSQFHYCEYYYACRQRPCCCPQNHFQKSHDFELDQSVWPHQKYIIQTRAPLGLLISWFEMRLLKKREKNTPQGFNTFEKQKMEYVRGFKKKWIESPIRNRLVIDYDTYLAYPAENLCNVLEFFDDVHQVNLAKVKNIVQDVLPAKDNSQFRFYDSALFRSQVA